MLAILLSIFLLTNPAIADDSKVEWLDAVEHNFGDLKANKPVKVDFRFKNISEAPLTIDNVRTTCGCTAPDWSDEVVAPGETGSINIEFDAKKEGYFRKKITVFFSGQRQGEKLYIEGYVE